MTGFGRGSVSTKQGTITAQVRSVNGRFMDLKIRGLDLDPETEQNLRTQITEFLKRGSVIVTLQADAGDGKSENLSFNRSKYEAIENILKKIQKDYGRKLELSEIISAEDLFTFSDRDNGRFEGAEKAVTKACRQVDAMRKAEGKKIRQDLASRCSILKKDNSELQKLARSESKSREGKYRSRIQVLADSVELDENRLAQEIAILAEKADISEELVRLSSHLGQFKSLLNDSEPVGKRLNFVLQELSRELNTVGAKVSSEKAVNLVIDMKSEAERMREQVQNIL